MRQSSPRGGKRVPEKAADGKPVGAPFAIFASPDSFQHSVPPMRHNLTAADPEGTRPSFFGARRLIAGLVIGATVIWAGVAFAQEAYLSHKLSQQVAALRTENAVIAAQNQAYRKDVQGITSGSASEEEARRSGYARPNEHLYLVTVSPSPSPTPPPSASPTSSPRSH
jgi:cell division protein FtsB